MEKKGTGCLFASLPLALGQVESDAGGLLQGSEEGGGLMGFLGHEMGDREDVAEDAGPI